MENTVKQRLIDFISTQKITVAAFERRCGFSNGYLKSLRECPSGEKINRILAEFPNLSRVWLLAGEGAMLNDGTTINQSNVNGNNNVNEGEALRNAINEIGEQRKLTTKAQEQIDRLLAIIEKLT